MPNPVRVRGFHTPSLFILLDSGHLSKAITVPVYYASK